MPQSLSLYDTRPFFEKALVFGVQNGLIDDAKMASIREDAPKGMVQIARYFGSEFLRPELERAKERIVNLVSLHLENHTAGDLRLAAECLRDHSFLSRSKAGSDMLKAMIVMPQNSHFGMNERIGFNDDHIPVLAKWSLKSLPEYQTELAKRRQVAQLIDAAIWLADTLGQDADDLEDAGKDAEAVIRSSLLSIACKRSEMPDWISFEKMVAGLRKKHATAPSCAFAMAVILPKGLPVPLKACVETVRQSVIADLPKILDPTLSVKKLFRHTPAFMERYFWLEDAVSEVDHYERTVSATWGKVTGGHTDEGSLLTLFLGVAAGAAPKTMLTEKAAASLVRKIRKSGLQPHLAQEYIALHAPLPYQADYARMWVEFIEEAQPTLQSDFDYALNDALALLRRECNVQQ
jgi:hypothetical protein